MKLSSGKRIFVVDDDPVWLNVMCQMLSQLGYTNVSAFDSASACMKYLHLYPSLIFLDQQMEEMNGIDFLPILKKKTPEAAVIFCTAEEDLKTAVSALRNGSFDYLVKSKCGLDELKLTIDELDESGLTSGRIF